MALNNKKAKLLFFYFLKKESSKFFQHLKENTWKENALTYTSQYFNIFQRIISNVFSRNLMIFSLIPLHTARGFMYISYMQSSTQCVISEEYLHGYTKPYTIKSVCDSSQPNLKNFCGKQRRKPRRTILRHRD